MIPKAARSGGQSEASTAELSSVKEVTYGMTRIAGIRGLSANQVDGQRAVAAPRPRAKIRTNKPPYHLCLLPANHPAQDPRQYTPAPGLAVGIHGHISLFTWRLAKLAEE